MHSIPVHTISAAVLLCFSLSVLPQTMTENHVLTEFFLEPSGVRSVKSADYYDGLGRRVQTVSGGKNACGLYTVAHSVLDSHGLDSVSWLPVAGGSVPDMASAASLSERPYGDGAAYSVTLRDALGRVTSVTRSGGAGAVRYDHDLHGWVTSVEGRGFSETLHYADGLGVPLYNGSVSSRQWQCDGDPYLRGYKYSYDSLGRMTDAVYG